MFKLSTRMFKARTSRTLLTVLGMSIGIGAILFLVSLGYGLQKTLLERITTDDSLVTLDVTESKSGMISLSRDVVKRISEMEGVLEVSPAFQITGQGRNESLSADVVIMGAKPSFLRLGGFKASKGDMLSDENENGIIIDTAVAQVFGKDAEEMIGTELTFTFFVARGDSPASNVSEDEEDSESGNQRVLDRIDSDKKFTIIGAVDGEDNVIYISDSALEFLQVDRYSHVKVKTKGGDVMGNIRDEILEMGLLVSALSDTVEQANQIFQIIQVILMLFGVVALVVSAIGMFNTMTITLLERTEEIGIMKSIGATDATVSLLFIMESAVMGFLGGLAGVLIGILGGEVFNGIINLVATRFGGEKVDLFFSPLWFVGVIIAFGAVVGIFTGVVPARRASKIDPLDALRYK